jgi:hypothetical protein
LDIQLIISSPTRGGGGPENASEANVMVQYFVSYDLINNKDYKRLINELKKLGALRMLESNWCLSRSGAGESKNLRDHFKKFIDNDDRLVVSEVTDWAGIRMLDNPNNLT